MTARVTQADVARLAGVSQATVSLVLNAEYDRVGEATRRRVLDAITRTGYAANPLAQRLARGRNQIVGVFTYEPVFPSTSADFYFPFLRGIEAEAERRACDLLLFTSAPVADGRRSLTGQGRARLAVTDGCVLLGRGEDKAELARLSEDGFPFVFVGRRELPGGADLAFVGADYIRATADVVRVFLDHGHRRIGFVGAPGGREAHQDRLDGYRTAIRDAGLRPLTIDPDELTPDEIADLARDNRLTGLLLAESHRAEELRAAAGRRGLDVPRDLSLAVLGQPELPLHSDLSWTGFRIPREEMGRQALALLAELIDGRMAERHRLLPCSPQPGETVAAAR
ncbi:LacI family transcriptional regulator [Streptomyces sp. YC504]|uniref:LacI family transcriptional regulator n=1 Tax=Streptomyces mesophilus TaxID=1775132 RepID=A0A6G4XMR4_9ACTN|nr:LacI family DNA-binding transcriptional regulator [Streptomyces mesophilus]NGO77901.1 LacI family transcriptional regulator [Streptomyces mesophilus]